MKNLFYRPNPKSMVVPKGYDGYTIKNLAIDFLIGGAGGYVGGRGLAEGDVGVITFMKDHVAVASPMLDGLALCGGLELLRGAIYLAKNGFPEYVPPASDKIDEKEKNRSYSFQAKAFGVTSLGFAVGAGIGAVSGLVEKLN
ncbi:hypothetical protein HN789_04120 [archaeon]|jgi:hypothetical protein|nr:hypothetical protein [archaeon]MBT4022490.1 hypothetical protein [archaeon]MBT4272329.1 hypothetical protein [archaeon]MBT4460438.1 hypothetical protein [archaeon]MBT4858457.1 hypothetical protein [archaeon]